MEELRDFLIEHERYDLMAILESLLDEIDFSPDEDYIPPEKVREPLKEFHEGSADEESDYEVELDEDGFLSLS